LYEIEFSELVPFEQNTGVGSVTFSGGYGCAVYGVAECMGNELVHAGSHARVLRRCLEECPHKGVALSDGTCT